MSEESQLEHRRNQAFAHRHGKSVAQFIADQQEKDPKFTGRDLLDELYKVVGTEGNEHSYMVLNHYATDCLSDALAEYALLWPKADDILVLNPESSVYEPMGQAQVHWYLDFLGLCGDRIRKANEAV